MGSHFLILGDLPDPGIDPGSPTLRADSLPSESPGATITRIHPFIFQMDGKMRSRLDEWSLFICKQFSSHFLWASGGAMFGKCESVSCSLVSASLEPHGL